MRDRFAKELTQLATYDDRIVLISGDIGNRMFDQFKDIAPNRFINSGIAEANMMSVAAGLGLSGLRPVVYTIAPFTTARCYEQIRIGVVYHESPVLIVGTGAGLSYAPLGATHHALDDIGLFSSIGPEIDIYTPADPTQVGNQLKYFFNQEKPAYMRLGKKGEPNLTFNKQGSSSLKSQLIRDGKDIVIFTIGPILSEAIAAANNVNNNLKSIDPAVVSLGAIEPLDEVYLWDLIKKNFKQWIIVEEHGSSGGGGERLNKFLNSNKLHGTVKLECLNTGSSILQDLGSQDYLRSICGINHQAISDLLKKL